MVHVSMYAKEKKILGTINSNISRYHRNISYKIVFSS